MWKIVEVFLQSSRMLFPNSAVWLTSVGDQEELVTGTSTGVVGLKHVSSGSYDWVEGA
jgi:hypothetical protein